MGGGGVSWMTKDVVTSKEPTSSKLTADKRFGKRQNDHSGRLRRLAARMEKDVVAGVWKIEVVVLIGKGIEADPE